MSRGAGSETNGAAVEALLQEKLSFFRGLNAELVALQQAYFSVRQVAAGEELWHEGEAGEYLAFVLSGCMQLKKDTEFGGKPVVVGVFSAGAVIGELSFSRNDVRVVTAAALEDCQVAVLTRSRFDALVKDHPALGVKLLETVLQATCKRLEKSYERLAAIF
jgi:CRP-like cAMP-binding protein